MNQRPTQPTAGRLPLTAPVVLLLVLCTTAGTYPGPITAGAQPDAGSPPGRAGLLGAFFRIATNVSDSPSPTSLARTSPRSIVLDPDGTLFALWMERIVHTEGETREIALKTCRPGAGWDSLMTPVAWWDGAASTDPACAIDHGGALHLAWIDRRPGRPQVFAQLFDRRHARVSEPLQLSDGSAPAADVAVATGPDGEVHAVWTEISGSRSTIRHRSATPDGRWSPVDAPPVPVRPVAPAAYAPEIAVDDAGRAHCVWEWGVPEGVGIGHASWSRELGWSACALVAPATAGRYAQTPVVAASPTGDLWVAWAVLEADESSRILLRRLSAAGVWEGARTVAASPIEVVAPAIAVDHWGTVHLLWEEGRPGSGDEDDAQEPTRAIMYTAVAPEAGAEPLPPRALTPPHSGPHHRPMIAVDPGGRIVAAWLDEMSGLGDLFVRVGVSGFAPLDR